MADIIDLNTAATTDTAPSADAANADAANGNASNADAPQTPPNGTPPNGTPVTIADALALSIKDFEEAMQNVAHWSSVRDIARGKVIAYQSVLNAGSATPDAPNT